MPYNYREDQLEPILAEKNFHHEHEPPQVRVKFCSDYEQTKYMSVTVDEFKAMKAILLQQETLSAVENNLAFCSAKTKAAVKGILASPVTSDFTKTIIKEGLTKDCVDAVAYVDDATKALQMVRDDCLYYRAFNGGKVNG